MAPSQLGVDVFARGAPEAMITVVRPAFEATLYDLLSAYGDRRRKKASGTLTIGERHVWSLAEAREALERLVGRSLDWLPLDVMISALALPGSHRRTATASAFAASLELAREGRIDLRQEGLFTPIEMRPRAAASTEAN